MEHANHAKFQDVFHALKMPTNVMLAAATSPSSRTLVLAHAPQDLSYLNQTIQLTNNVSNAYLDVPSVTNKMLAYNAYQETV